MATQLAVIGGPAFAPALPDPAFTLADMAIFTAIPAHDHEVAALNGMVVVFNAVSIHREGILEDAFYVRESQQPAACMSWESWLKLEASERDLSRMGCPRSPLRIRREVVQAIRWPYANNWSVRLASGHIDGPYHDWAFGRDLIGKVVGLFLPKQREA